ncbi:GNAT family N-acetyltransferase [Falsiporphyromonas endometrii]|uniref:GNAT family N-acetyltransferase n=1 Tax=Falsiporphyromonas endometrii TaxID=1387297 RepID=A0ABV9K6L3_9PORP
MRFLRINAQDPKSLQLADSLMRPLYLSAFPRVERRPWDELVDLIAKQPAFRAHIIYIEDKPVGFFNYWEFPSGIIYGEHLAIYPENRQKGLGTLFLEKLKDMGGDRMIFEVEIPNNPLAKRRINFYERNGFVLLDNMYWQPPYHDDLKPFEMKLMCSTEIKDTINVDKAISELYQLVYNYKQ